MLFISLRQRGKLLENSKSAKTETFCTADERNTGYCPRITVLGVGNILLKDEGAGVHLVQRLADKVNCDNLDIVDGGTDPDIISLVDDRVDKLIIVDAARAGDKPGSIYRFNIEDLDTGSSDHVSLHEIGVMESLRMMALLNRKPKSVAIIGIEPKTIDPGLELSPEVEEKMPQVIELVLEEIKETNTSMEVAR